MIVTLVALATVTAAAQPRTSVAGRVSSKELFIFSVLSTKVFHSNRTKNKRFRRSERASDKMSNGKTVTDPWIKESDEEEERIQKKDGKANKTFNGIVVPLTKQVAGYMDGGLNDIGWGCVYRNVQTLRNFHGLDHCTVWSMVKRIHPQFTQSSKTHEKSRKEGAGHPHASKVPTTLDRANGRKKIWFNTECMYRPLLSDKERHFCLFETKPNKNHDKRF